MLQSSTPSSMFLGALDTPLNMDHFFVMKVHMTEIEQI